MADQQSTTTTTAAKDLTLEEKQRLAQMINDMSMNSMVGVVHILMKHLPDLKDQAGSELKIDLDGLESDVLRELDNYCKQDSVNSSKAALQQSLGVSGSFASSHDGAPSAKKAKTVDSGDKKNAASDAKQPKLHILAGCERLLRAAGQPLSPYDLLIQGTDAGYFQVSGHANVMPDKQLSNILHTDIKSGKGVFESVNNNQKFGLVEFGLSGDEKAAHVALRNATLAQVPPYPTPASQDERNLLRAKFVHQGLWQNQNAWIFDKPVDAVKFGLVDYHVIITEPMDIGTVKNRLYDGYYRTLEEYKREVNLVWANAMKYNPPQDPVHQMALEYAGQFQHLLKEYGLE